MGLRLSGRIRGLGKWRRSLVMAGAGLVVIGLANVAGCPAPTYPQLFPGVTLADITEITTADLSDAEKEEQLRELGITDEQVLYFLIHATLPTTSE